MQFVFKFKLLNFFKSQLELKSINWIRKDSMLRIQLTSCCVPAS